MSQAQQPDIVVGYSVVGAPPVAAPPLYSKGETVSNSQIATNDVNVIGNGIGAHSAPAAQAMMPPLNPEILRRVADLRQTGQTHRIRYSEAVGYANSVLPVYASHVTGCKLCYMGPVPCPLCAFFLSVATNGEADDEAGCLCPVWLCFGLPCLIYSCVVCSAERGPGSSWIFRGKHGEKSCECVVVDKEAGVLNCYKAKTCSETPEQDACCTWEPIGWV